MYNNGNNNNSNYYYYYNIINFKPAGIWRSLKDTKPTVVGSLFSRHQD